MLSLQNAGKRFGPRILFTEANWLIRNNEKTALVGANGTGKSTLMKVLAGLETLDYGELQRTRGMSIGYLPQEGLRLTGRTIFEECLTVFDEIREMEGEIERLGGQMAELDHESAEYASTAERFSLLQERFHALDGYALDAQVGAVLTGLGFGKEDWSRLTDEFSGGWQMRIALAKLLLAKPNLLLLDEPTNHLDLETRNWLEEYLKAYPFGYILISHDRYFLDVTIDRTVEIWNKRLTIYNGNYTKYLSQKDERKAQLEAAYKNQRDQIEHLEAFISRFRYQATKAKQVQSRIKELEKIERIEIPEEEPVIHFKFPQPQPSGRMVVEADALAKSYGEKKVLENVRFTIERGDRVALVGVNGAGKSTLIKLMMGLEAASAGMVKLGHNVVPEYFAQDQYKVLDAEARMLDDISRAAVKVPESELRSLLGCFLFSGDDVFKPLGVLSGGERNRFALARILVSPSNFLLLDEPTNHLDMRAKDVLLEAIANFSGTVVFVSHDRYFIDRLATRVLEVENGTVTTYEGNYEDYLRKKEELAAGLIAGSIASAVPTPVSKGERPGAPISGAPGSMGNTIVIEGGPEGNGAGAKNRRLNPIKQKQMEERCAFLEEEVPRVEAALAHTEQQLGVYVSAAETQRLTTLAEDLRGQLQALTAEWEELMMQLEA
ncbi:ribosomal protection-like ABC-F family protein [Occallatibacter riparius]|uniref:ABC-F family ATP-binding cassette domain-containing protein n=1 Tax=Occallatibacter riparius TaxID=1002689 RepID=A0A9J7BV36_9BACT|nr:ABC-F family ATP-binding cassette domain-containing protein [Occallatibacter riparius]UWZ84774.1 ABC-F family ATP-binding cassette domain-containing protein [Occallatibacter riparius]